MTEIVKLEVVMWRHWLTTKSNYPSSEVGEVKSGQRQTCLVLVDYPISYHLAEEVDYRKDLIVDACC